MSLTRRLWPVSPTLWPAGLRLMVLLTPTLLLGLAAMRIGGEAALWLGIGAVAQLVIAGLLVAYFHTLSPPIGPTVLACYVAALVWVWGVVPAAPPDWFLHLAQAILVLAPLITVAGYTLHHSGAFWQRRALKLAEQLSKRPNWPADLNQCRDLPEIKAFRDAVHFDASPALRLLSDRRPQVRLAALLALEYRKHWRPGQAENLLAVLKREQEPLVRVAAINALANIDDRYLVESLCEYLRDPDGTVRRAAADALLWNLRGRWNWIRFGVRQALSDRALRHDGPLIREGQVLEPDVVNDLTAWSAEKGVLSVRATEMLAVHYHAALLEQGDELVPQLNRIVQDPHSPPLLRIEVARLLFQSKAIDEAGQENLLDPANPAPMRLMAAEALLEAGPHVRAIVALRELARLPNRELALNTADVVQKRLGVDLGLAIGEPLPPLHSRRAIEVTRRLMAWASQSDPSDNVLDSDSALRARASIF